MKKTALFALMTTFTFAVLQGCGGNVLVETGDGGGGGDGGSGGTTTTSGSSSPAAPVAFCGQLCTTISQVGCLQGSSVAECVTSCLDLIAQSPGCEDEIMALYGCALENIDSTCTSVSNCDAETIAYGECTSGPIDTCGVDSCAGDELSCSCQGTCDGQILQADCKQDSNGEAFCICTSDGFEVGTCFDASLSCDILGGCCSVYFFGFD